MKKIYYGFFLCISLLSFLVVWHQFDPLSSIPANAQGRCVNPPPDTIASRWPTGATVSVKIHSAFTEGEREAVENAFRDWNSTNLANCSNVTFDGFDVLDSEPFPHLNWHWVGFDPSTSGHPGETFWGASEVVSLQKHI